jgi:hypothetical protein
MFAIRSGDWKLIEGLGSGGFTEPVTIPYTEGMPAGQLYHMKNDTQETTNLYASQTQLVDSLSNVLEQIRRQ